VKSQIPKQFVCLLHPHPPPSHVQHARISSLLINRTQQLCLQYELPLLVLLARLIRLIILPPHRLLALPTMDVPHYMFPRRHISLHSLSLRDVDNTAEEIGLAVLAAKVARHDGLAGGEVRFAVLAAEDFVGVEVDVVD
jgi:hypothetical protein